MKLAQGKVRPKLLNSDSYQNIPKLNQKHQNIGVHHPHSLPVVQVPGCTGKMRAHRPKRSKLLNIEYDQNGLKYLCRPHYLPVVQVPGRYRKRLAPGLTRFQCTQMGPQSVQVGDKKVCRPQRIKTHGLIRCHIWAPCGAFGTPLYFLNRFLTRFGTLWGVLG